MFCPGCGIFQPVYGDPQQIISGLIRFTCDECGVDLVMITSAWPYFVHGDNVPKAA